jgi:Protein of unknown function (DUF3224)
VGERNKTHATGRIEVASYEPKPYDEPSEGPQLVEIHVRERFVGDIEGEGVVRFLQAQRQDGSASFVGIERVSGRIADRAGTFLLQDAGTLEGENSYVFLFDEDQVVGMYWMSIARGPSSRRAARVVAGRLPRTRRNARSDWSRRSPLREERQCRLHADPLDGK